MQKYFFKRVLIFLPGVWLATVIIFLLSSASHRDKVHVYLEHQGLRQDESADYLKKYNEKYAELGLDRPLFYFAIVPHYYPPNIRVHSNFLERDFIRGWLKQGYEYDAIINLINTVSESESSTSSLSLDELYAIRDFPKLKEKLNSSGLDLKQSKVQDAFLILEKSHYTIHYPVFRWHGFRNQYHSWFMRILKADFGISYKDNRPVSSKIGNAITWTLILMLLNILIVVIIALPLGLLLAQYKNSFLDRIITSISFIIFSMPLFWIASMVLLILSGGLLGLDLLPSVRWYEYKDAGFFTKISLYITQLYPALLCLVIVDLAYLLRLIRAAAIEESLKPYTLLAFSKGLKPMQVLFRHIRPNAMIPATTLIVGSIPGTIGGSVIIEVVFGIPGMGRLLYDSINSADWAVVYTIVLLIAVLTSVFFLIGDFLYARLDPRIKY